MVGSRFFISVGVNFLPVLLDFTVLKCYHVKVSADMEGLTMNKKIKTDAVDYYFNAILSLETLEECYAFFEDVCTVNEILSCAQRLEVARMLRSKRTYLDIADKTGASTATISRVNRSLNYGNDGYDMIFERVNK